MSIVLAIAGLMGSALFAAAGYRASTNSRNQRLAAQIAYKGRVQVIYEPPKGSVALSVATMVKRAVIAKSAPHRPTQG